MVSTGAIRAGRAFVELFVVDKAFRAGLKKAQVGLKNFGESVGDIGRKFAGAGAALGAPFVASAVVFANFTDEVAKVGAIADTSDASLADLTETMKELGRTTSFTAKEAAEGATSLARAGFTAGQIIKALPGTLDLARATATDLGTAAEISGQALRGFGLEADEAGRVADVLTATANGSAQTLGDVGEALKDAAPLARLAGASIEDTAAALGILANQGIRGSKAGNALARAYKNLSTEAKQTELADLGEGIDVTDELGNLRPLADILRDIGEATADLGSAEKLDIFEGIFGRASASAVALAEASDDLDAFREGLVNAGGTARKTAQDMDDNLGGSFRLLTSAVEGAAIAIGGALESDLRELLDTVRDVVGGVTTFILRNKELVITAAKLAFGLVAVGGALVGIGIAAKAASLAVAGYALLQKGLIGLTAKLTIANAVFAKGFVASLATAKAAVVGFAATLGPLAVAIGAVYAAIQVGRILTLVSEIRAAREEAQKLEDQAAATAIQLAKMNRENPPRFKDAVEDTKELVKQQIKAGKSAADIRKELENRRKTAILTANQIAATLNRDGGKSSALGGENLVAQRKRLLQVAAAASKQLKAGFDEFKGFAEAQRNEDKKTTDAEREQQKIRLKELNKRIRDSKQALKDFQQFQQDIAKTRQQETEQKAFEQSLLDTPIQAVDEAGERYADAVTAAADAVKRANDALNKAIETPTDENQAAAKAATAEAAEAAAEEDRQQGFLAQAIESLAANRKAAADALKQFDEEQTERLRGMEFADQLGSLQEGIEADPGKALAEINRVFEKEIAEADAAVTAASNAFSKAAETGKAADRAEAERLAGLARREQAEADQVKGLVEQAQQAVADAAQNVAAPESTFGTFSGAAVAGGAFLGEQKTLLEQLREQKKIAENTKRAADEAAKKPKDPALG